MCHPAVIPAIAVAVSAAGTGASMLGARSAEKATAKAQIANTNYAMANFAQQANANNTRYAQEVEKTQQDAQQIYLENLQRQATAQTSAAGSGVTGISIENLFRGYDRTTALSNFIAERNIRNMGLQYNDNYDALRMNAIGSIYGIPQYQGSNMTSSMLSGIGGILSSTAMSDLSSKLTTGK